MPYLPIELETILSDKIPMAKCMEIKVIQVDDLQLHLFLPLDINKNHKSTQKGNCAQFNGQFVAKINS